MEPLLKAGVEEMVGGIFSLVTFDQFPGEREIPCEQHSDSPLLGSLAARGSI